MLTFHRDVYVPDVLRARLPRGRRPLHYTTHARTEASRDRVPALPDSLEPTAESVVELTVGAKLQLVKLLVRVRLDDHRDLCLVVVPNGEGFRAITVWVNRRDDTHRTLRRDLYVPSPN